VVRTRSGGELKISENPEIALLLVLVSGVAVFIIDIVSAHGYITNLLYIIPLLLSFSLPAKNSAYFVMTGITVVVIAAVFFKPAPVLPAVIPVYLIIFNRGLSIMCGWVLAWILQRHRSALRELVAREKELRFIIDAGPALISYIGADSRYIRVNKIYTQWFGHAVDQVEGRHVREVLGEEAWRAILPHIEQALSGRSATYEAKLSFAGGGPRWVRATYTPDIEGSGHVRGFVVQAIDVGEQKKIEENLSREKAFTDSLINGLPGIFYLCDKNGRFLRWNRNLEEVSGHCTARSPP
jgi:PAS domain S-box